MQATNTRKMKHTTKPIEHLCEAAESSSEVESDRPGRSYQDYLYSLKTKVTVAEKELVSSDEELVRDISSQHSDHEVETDGDDPGSRGESESEVPDCELEQEVGRSSVRTPRS